MIQSVLQHRVLCQAVLTEVGIDGFYRWIFNGNITSLYIWSFLVKPHSSCRYMMVAILSGGTYLCK